MKSCFLLTVFLLILSGKTNAQNFDRATHRSIPIKVALLDESISPPNLWFTRYTYNPAVTIGVEYPLSNGRHHEWFLQTNLGFYFHRHFRTALFLNAGGGYRRYIGRFNISLGLAAGYSHVYATEPVYAFNGNTYEEVNNNGQGVFMPSAELALGYKLHQGLYSPEIYLTYQFAADSPFSGVKLVPHDFVGLGAKLYPFK